MNLRPLIIDEAARAKVAEVEAFASKNWYHPGKSETIPGDDQRHIAKLGTYRCVFSYTVAEERLFRHLSISVPGKKYPNPFAALTIAELFGFTGWDGKTWVPPKDWMIGPRPDEHCVTLLQRVQG